MMLDRLLSSAGADEGTIARGRVVNLLALVIVIFIPVYTVVTIITTPGELTAGGALSLAAAVVLGVVCYVLSKRGRVLLAGYVLLVGLLLAISLYMLDPGNKILDLSVAPALYILAIVPASYVIHPLASVILTTVAAIYTFLLLFLAPPLAYRGYEDQASFLSNHVLIFALAYVLSAVSWVFRRGTEDALRRSQEHNRELQDLTAELEAKRRIQAEAGRQILEVADRLADSSRRGARGSSRQAAAVAQVSASMEQLNQSAREIANTAGLVDDAARQTLEGAHDGQEILTRHGLAMAFIQERAGEGAAQATALEDRLQQISRVATLISNLASQIQLVAFNATLEAAEAGDTGRRFGVVAAEVKDLASDSLNQAKHVANIIRLVQEVGDDVVALSSEQMQAVKAGTELASRSGEANEAIIGLATQMAERTQQIELATAQQLQAVEQVLGAMQEVRAVADRWVVSSYQMDQMVARLKSLAEQLA